MNLKLLFVITFSIFNLSAFAIAWKGKIVDAESKIPLQGVSVINSVSQKIALTNNEGFFEIEGNEGDKVVFNCPGYKSENHIIIKGIEGIRLSFGMKMISHELHEVIVKQKYKTQYQRDSAERHSEQARILARNKSSIGSPVSFIAEKLSRRQKALFRFQKNFYKNEKQLFIDSRYSPELVASLTQLSGDTLAYFMNSYPMEYEYARAATPLELKFWVKYNYKDFLGRTDSLRKLQIPIIE